MCLEALEESGDSTKNKDHNFLGMMDHVLKKNKNIEDLLGKKGHLLVQLVVLEEQWTIWAKEAKSEQDSL